MTVAHTPPCPAAMLAHPVVAPQARLPCVQRLQCRDSLFVALPHRLVLKFQVADGLQAFMVRSAARVVAAWDGFAVQGRPSGDQQMRQKAQASAGVLGYMAGGGQWLSTDGGSGEMGVGG